MAQQLEARLVNEYISQNFPYSPQWRRVRLGPLPDKLNANMYKSALRWADAVVIGNGVVVIIEAKMTADTGAIGQLDYYADLFSRTPEFSLYWRLPVKKLFLTAVDDQQLRSYCAEKGVEYVFFCPPWAKLYLKKRFNY